MMPPAEASRGKRSGGRRSVRMAKDFLLEVGTEEMPASCLPQTLREMEARAGRLLDELRLGRESLEVVGTPRRLSLLVYGLEERQGEVVREIFGPPRSVAYDENGKPTKALEKFCARYGAGPDAVEIVEKEKGEYVLLRKEEGGRKTVELLSEVLPEWILSLPFPKSMRWGDLDVRFVRPIRWIAALYGEEAVPFELAGLASAPATYGHRFFNGGEPIRLRAAGEYFGLLMERKVVVRPEERRGRILAQARAAAEEVGGRIIEDEELIETLVHITEYPVAVPGGFADRFLSLPREVLIATMKDHQKYFAVEGPEGKDLLPHFVAIANTEVPEPDLVRKGNEKVLGARLEDAKFFFDEDTKAPLERHVEGLKGVIYHKKLGTSYEKVLRIQRLGRYLGEAICPDRLPAIERAALLCKADLLTQMVGEFPELQGIMGGIYAAVGGEPEEVATAIREHYLPVSAEGDLPVSMVGRILSLADKMDTVAGFFSIGNPVSGTSDPFGMRRRAIGILRILLDAGWEISLPALVEAALEGLEGIKAKAPRDEVKEEILRFFRLRYHQILLGKGFPHDTVEAVLARSFENIPDLLRRVEMLHGMRAEPDFDKLILGCKRAVNILEQARERFGFEGPAGPLREEDLGEEAERRLFEAVRRVEGEIKRGMREKAYDRVFDGLAGLKGPIDRFFDEVMVLVDDARIRENRLSLLHDVAQLFQQIADFSKISL